MVMNQVMININEAKTHLSRYAKRVRQGETIILCDRNRPFAEIRALAAPLRQRRPFGLAKGRMTVPDDFNQPDPLIRQYDVPCLWNV